MQENKEELRKESFLKRHKKTIIIIAGIVVVTGLSIFGIKKYVNSLPIQKYSIEWFSDLTDEMLEAEREKVRVEFCNSGSDRIKASQLQRLLYAFDNEMSKRSWRNEKPYSPSIHREHGWYLPNNE